MKKNLVIYNPISGRRKHRQLIRLIKKNFPRQKYFLEFMTYENFTREKTIKRSWSYDLIIIAGGDGTIREVASFLLKNDIDIPLGIVPLGSANMLAQSLGMPTNLSRALKAIRRGRPEKIDVGRINDSCYFIDAFALGYVAERIIAADSRMKTYLGFFGYLLSFFLHRRFDNWDFHFSVDGQEYQQKGHSLFIVNTSRLFRFRTKRKHDLSDGKFELTVVTNKNFWSLFPAFFYYYFHHKPVRHLIITEGQEFIIHTPVKTLPQIDGDYIDIKDQELKIEVLNRRLTIIKPRNEKN